MSFHNPLFMVSALLCLSTVSVAAEVSWPAETLTSATNLTAVEGAGTNDFFVNMSSAFWNPVTRRLWVCRNGGTDGSKFWALREDGNGSFEIDVQGGLRGEWTNFGDLEAITQTDYSESVVFLMIEGEERIKECRVAVYGTAVITNNWNTAPFLPLSGGSGAEGLCFIPDSFLIAAGFVDQNGNPYVSQNGMGGLMFVAHQNGGRVYAFDLNRTNSTFTFVGAYKTNFSESCELTFDRSDGRLYILHGADHNTIEVTNLVSTVVGSERQFTELATYGRPTGSPGSWNLEGFAIMPNTDCSSNQRSAFLTIDDGGSQSLLWYKQFPCTCVAGDPSITAHPDPATICTGGTNQFCVTASGSGSVTYQWRKDDTDISGATSSCFTASTAGDYRCVVTGTCGSVTSNAATLTVNSAPSIQTHPTGFTSCAGQAQQLCVVATGSGTLTYQWQLGGVDISGATMTCFTPTVSGTYRCVVTNSCGSTDSDTASVTINSVPAVSSHPSDQTACADQLVPLCVAASGSGTLTFQWRRNEVHIGDATQSCFTPATSGSYRCAVSNSCGTAVSNAATVTANTPPPVSVQPVGASICGGASHQFCALSTDGSASYQWQANGVDIPGATSSCLTAAEPKAYRCVLSNTCGTTFSDEVLLTVGTVNTWFRDADGDGFGSAAETIVSCDAPQGFVSNNGDCNDNSSLVHPGALETCDGIDNNCDGSTDLGCVSTELGNEPYPDNSDTKIVPPASGSLCGTVPANSLLLMATCTMTLACIPRREKRSRRVS